MPTDIVPKLFEMQLKSHIAIATGCERLRMCDFLFKGFCLSKLFNFDVNVIALQLSTVYFKKSLLDSIW
jgi:hypothetical protein